MRLDREPVRWWIFVATTALLTLAACVSLEEVWDSVVHPASGLAPPPLDSIIRIHETANGEEHDLESLLDRLAKHDAVFLGETHLDETTHRVELALYEGLIRRTGGKVVLALEMFERDVQPVLDDYTAGRITEGEFLAKSRPWKNYRTGYRPLVEAARREGLPVMASNPPASLRRKIAFGGRETLDSLTAEERGWLPEELYPNSDAYWERFKRVTRGHMAAMMARSPESRLTSSQTLWDNSMGETAAKAIEANPGSVVLHINGSFHSICKDGAVAQLMKRLPEAKVAVVETIAVNDLAAVRAPFDSTRADFLVYAESRARGLSEGFHGVTIFPDLRYRLHMPERASDADPVPLLIWLPDDGARTEDSLALWKSALGDEAAVAVVEAPNRQIEYDLHTGGRWFWKDTFNDEIGTVQGGLERIFGYVIEHYPVKADAVVLAGGGAGATMVAASVLYSDALHLPAIVAAPRRFAGLRQLPLPDPHGDVAGDVGLSGKRLTVLAGDQDEEWWRKECDAYRTVHLDCEVKALPRNDWDRFHEIEAAVRGGLGLAPRSAVVAPAEPATLLVLACDTPLAREWARLLGRRIEASGKKVAIVHQSELGALLESGATQYGAVHPLVFRGESIDLGAAPRGVTLREAYSASEMASGKCLPVAPGAFGGTTIVIIPAGADEDERAAWKSIEKEGAIRKRSRFASLRLVFEGEGDTLASALEELGAQRRTSVVIVPALFCAPPETMRRWSKETAPHEDVLDITWLPGLGGRLHLLEE